MEKMDAALKEFTQTLSKETKACNDILALKVAFVVGYQKAMFQQLQDMDDSLAKLRLSYVKNYRINLS